MRDAKASDTTDWAHRVLATCSQRMGAGGHADVARLAQQLAQAPWWKGCPSAAGLLATGMAPGYRRVPLVAATDAGYSALLIVWPPGHSTPIHDTKDCGASRW